MDEFAFFFDSSQIVEEVHVIEPPRRKAQVLLFPRKIKPEPVFVFTYSFVIPTGVNWSVWPGAP